MDPSLSPTITSLEIAGKLGLFGPQFSISKIQISVTTLYILELLWR